MKDQTRMLSFKSLKPCMVRFTIFKRMLSLTSICNHKNHFHHCISASLQKWKKIKKSQHPARIWAQRTFLILVRHSYQLYHWVLVVLECRIWISLRASLNLRGYFISKSRSWIEIPAASWDFSLFIHFTFLSFDFNNCLTRLMVNSS